LSALKQNPVTVRILEQEYRIACDPGEEDGLIAAARYLHQQMSEMRATGKVIGAERLATMVALNLSHDLLQMQDATTRSAKGLNQRIKTMRERLDRALNESNQLEL
jgi:cell division protein ZapA